MADATRPTVYTNEPRTVFLRIRALPDREWVVDNHIRVPTTKPGAGRELRTAIWPALMSEAAAAGVTIRLEPAGPTLTATYTREMQAVTIDGYTPTTKPRWSGTSGLTWAPVARPTPER